MWMTSTNFDRVLRIYLSSCRRGTEGEVADPRCSVSDEVKRRGRLVGVSGVLEGRRADSHAGIGLRPLSARLSLEDEDQL